MSYVDTYAECRHGHGDYTYNSTTAIARLAVLEALAQIHAACGTPLNKEEREILLESVDWINYPGDIIIATEQVHGIIKKENQIDR